VNRTGPALGDTAAELGAGHLEIFPDYPKQGNISLRLDGVGFSVDFQGDCLSHKPLLSYVLKLSDERMEKIEKIGHKVAFPKLPL
jgi:hypothetical protein